MKAEVLGEKKLGKKSSVRKDLMLGYYLVLKRGSYYVIIASSIYLEMRNFLVKGRGGVEIFYRKIFSRQKAFAHDFQGQRKSVGI